MIWKFHISEIKNWKEAYILNNRYTPKKYVENTNILDE